GGAPGGRGVGAERGRPRRRGGQRRADRQQADVAGREDFPLTPAGEQPPGPRGDDDVLGAHLLIGRPDVGEGVADGQELAAVEDAADVEVPHRAGADGDAQRQADALGGLVGAQGFLNGEGALRGPEGEGGQALAAALVLPDGQEGVAGELDDVAAVGGDDVDEPAEVGVEQPRELLGPRCAPGGQALGEGGKAGDVGEQDSGRLLLAGRQGDGRGVGDQAADDERRQVTGNSVEDGRAAHAVWLAGLGILPAILKGPFRPVQSISDAEWEHTYWGARGSVATLTLRSTTSTPGRRTSTL